ncbi:MAG: cupin domain-containing protein [Lewinellaceae bacterium]|nr:cupin domain-containing protein [Lewinellaceae bacterium]
MILTAPSLSNSYWYIGHLISILISSGETKGAFSVIHGFEIQGLEPPFHIHTKEEESFYVMDGEMEFTVGNELYHVSKGGWIMLPRNIRHTFKVLTEKAEVLIQLSPGGFEEYFIAMSEPARTLEIPPRPQGPPNIQKLVETASRYGIIFPEIP